MKDRRQKSPRSNRLTIIASKFSNKPRTQVTDIQKCNYFDQDNPIQSNRIQKISLPSKNPSKFIRKCFYLQIIVHRNDSRQKVQYAKKMKVKRKICWHSPKKI